MHQNIPQPMQQQQPRVFIPQSNQQIQQHQSTPVHQPPSQDQTPKKRTTIKITDPNSGKDLTNEFKERKKKHQLHQGLVVIQSKLQLLKLKIMKKQRLMLPLLPKCLLYSNKMRYVFLLHVMWISAD